MCPKKLFANFCFAKTIALWLGLSAKDEYNTAYAVHSPYRFVHPNCPNGQLRISRYRYMKSAVIKSIKNENIYDTSVFGGYFDEEFAKWSKKLFVEFEKGFNTAVISDITLREFLCRDRACPYPKSSAKGRSLPALKIGRRAPMAERRTAIPPKAGSLHFNSPLRGAIPC